MVKHRKKQKKRRTAASDEKDAKDDNDNYDKDEDVAESGSGEELTSDNKDKECPSTSPRQGTEGTTMDPSRFIGDNEMGGESAVNRNIDTALPSSILPEPAAVEDIAHTPIVQLSTSNSGAAPLSMDTPLFGATPPSTDTPLSGVTPPSTNTLLSEATPPCTDTPPLPIEGPHSVTLPPMDVKLLVWFGKAYKQLTSGNLGQTFSATILNYIEFEKHTSFSIGVVGAGFKIDKRLNEVGLVFAGPVRWTGKKTEIGLNPTAKDRTTSCSCTNSEFFRLPVAMFVEKLKNRKKPV